MRISTLTAQLRGPSVGAHVVARANVGFCVFLGAVQVFARANVGEPLLLGVVQVVARANVGEPLLLGVVQVVPSILAMT